MKTIVVMIFAIVFIFAEMQAAEESGVKLPAKMKLGNKELVYNGAGTITKFFFKVYVIALYLESKTSDAKEILNKDVPYIIYMHFKRDGIGSDKIIEAWNQGFALSTNGKTEKIDDKIKEFNSWFDGIEMNENDTYRFEYQPGVGTKVYINNKYKGNIAGFAFKKALLGIWIGDNPRDDNVKEEMLGVDDD